MASTRRKSAAVALAIMGVAGLSLASAATLNVTTASLGAGSAVVGTCDADVSVAYTTTFDAAQGYVVTGATVNGLDGAACVNQYIGITVNGAVQTEQQITAADTSKSFTGLSIPAATLTDVAVVIHS